MRYKTRKMLRSLYLRFKRPIGFIIINCIGLPSKWLGHLLCVPMLPIVIGFRFACDLADIIEDIYEDLNE